MYRQEGGGGDAVGDAQSVGVSPWTRRASVEGLEEVLSDFCTISLRCAVIASMAGAKAVGRRLDIPAIGDSLLPRNPWSSGQRAVQRLDPRWHWLGTQLHSCLVALENARVLTPDELELPQGWVDGTGLDFAMLETIWRRACSEAQLLLLLILEVILPVGSQLNLRLAAAEQITRAAAEGLTPCVRSNGFVIVPEVADMRAHTRLTLDVQGWLVSGRGRTRITVRDLSLQGLGLAGCPPLARGEKVAVELMSGRALDGTIMWCHGGRAGFRLASALAPHDSLFTVVLASYRKRRP